MMFGDCESINPAAAYPMEQRNGSLPEMLKKDFGIKDRLQSLVLII